MVKLIRMALEYDIIYTNRLLDDMVAQGWEGCTLEVNNASVTEVIELVGSRGFQIGDKRKNPFFDTTMLLIRRRALW